jgi:hypothetical protein
MSEDAKIEPEAEVMYHNFVEVSGLNLDLRPQLSPEWISSNHREGGVLFYQVFLLSSS